MKVSPDDDIEDEQPLLLDPRCAADTELLWFDEDGQPQPHPLLCSDTNGYCYKKVQTSIEIYHLAHHSIVEKRLQLAQEIKKEVSDAETLWIRLNKKGDMTAQQELNSKLEILKHRCQPSAELSKFAIAVIKGLRGKYNVAEMIL